MCDEVWMDTSEHRWGHTHTHIHTSSRQRLAPHQRMFLLKDPGVGGGHRCCCPGPRLDHLLTVKGSGPVQAAGGANSYAYMSESERTPYPGFWVCFFFAVA